MNENRIALYVGNSLYPGETSDPNSTMRILQNSPLTSPILGLLNQNAANPNQLVYNDWVNPVFNIKGEYIGSSKWKNIIKSLREETLGGLSLFFYQWNGIYEQSYFER